MGRRRVVITGMGIISPIGLSLDEYWDSLINGRSGVCRITGFDTTDLTAKTS